MQLLSVVRHVLELDGHIVLVVAASVDPVLPV